MDKEKTVQIEVNKNDISWIKDELKTQSGLLWTTLITIIGALAATALDFTNLGHSVSGFLTFLKTILL